MENNFTEKPNSELVLDAEAQNALLGSAKWCLFLAIMGFIGLAFMVIAAILMSVTANAIPDNFGQNSPVGMLKGYISIFYIILAALYFPPTYYLYKYSTDIKSGIADQKSITISEALVSLKSHHKFLAISIIVVMSLYVVMIFGFVAMFAMKS